jgi:hypothetical protein
MFQLEEFLLRYSGIGPEVVETSHYYGNIHRIEDNGVASYLNKFLVNS